jgi:hypothetical protein
VLSGNASANFIEAISILVYLTINYDELQPLPISSDGEELKDSAK